MQRCILGAVSGGCPSHGESKKKKKKKKETQLVPHGLLDLIRDSE